jgi:hypothetical protein
MAINGFFSVHRRWEDWCSLAFGVVILFSPAFAPIADLPLATLNALVVGFLLILLAWQELMLLETWEEPVELVLGIWLMLSPWLLGYAERIDAAALHVGLGALVGVLSLLESWQDRVVAHHA